MFENSHCSWFVVQFTAFFRSPTLKFCCTFFCLLKMKNIKRMMDNTSTNARATIGTPIPAIIAVFEDELIGLVVLEVIGLVVLEDIGLVVLVLVVVPACQKYENR